MNTQKISKFEFYAMTLIFILANDVIRGIYFEEHRNNAWIIVLIGIVTSIVIVFIYLQLYRNFENQSFNEVIDKILGKIFSKIIFIFYPIYFVFTASLNLRDMTELVKTYLIDQAPLFILGLVLMIVVFYALNHSLEVIARGSILYFMIVEFVFIFFSLLVMIFNKPDFAAVIPTFDKGVKPILIDSLKYSYAVPLGELFVLLIIYPFISQKKNASKLFYLSIFQSGMMLLILTLLNIIYVAPESVIVDYSTALRVARTIDIELFIQRLDLLVINLIVFHVITKINILLFASRYLINHVIPFKKNYILNFILCLIPLFGSVMFFKNYDNLILFRKETMITTVRLIAEIIIPFALVFLSFFRKPKKKKKSKKQEKTNNDKQNKKQESKSNQNESNKKETFLTNIKNTFNKKVLKKP